MDVETGSLHVRCTPRGSRVDALAFSPDGTLMVTGGFQHTDLWDVASGANMLALDRSRHCFGGDFAPDGHRLAITTAWPSGRADRKDSSEVLCWNVANGRGVQTLRGLTSPISQDSVFARWALPSALGTTGGSRSGTGLPASRKRVLNAPEGITPDNAAMAFSTDGLKFACSSGTGAALGNESGGELGRWVVLHWAFAITWHSRIRAR